MLAHEDDGYPSCEPSEHLTLGVDAPPYAGVRKRSLCGDQSESAFRCASSWSLCESGEAWCGVRMKRVCARRGSATTAPGTTGVRARLTLPTAEFGASLGMAAGAVSELEGV